VLALADLQKLERLLGADELFQLTQEKIVMPMITVDNDKLLLSVLRPGYWQNLTLPDSESRKPLQQSLVPLGSPRQMARGNGKAKARAPHGGGCQK
jgi:hypothetical protein